jgi:hypothetical protein
VHNSMIYNNACVGLTSIGVHNSDILVMRCACL